MAAKAVAEKRKRRTLVAPRVAEAKLAATVKTRIVDMSNLDHEVMSALGSVLGRYVATVLNATTREAAHRASEGRRPEPPRFGWSRMVAANEWRPRNTQDTAGRGPDAVTFTVPLRGVHSSYGIQMIVDASAAWRAQRTWQARRIADKNRRIEVLERRCALPTHDRLPEDERPARVKIGRRWRLVFPDGRPVEEHGYPTGQRRWAKRQRLDILRAERARLLADAERSWVPLAMVSRSFSSKRHNLEAAGITVDDWQSEWTERRRWIASGGKNGALHGSRSIMVAPDGSVTILLPEALAHYANVKRGRTPTYRLHGHVRFPRGYVHADTWRDRVELSRAITYRVWETSGSWWVAASWTEGEVPAVPLDEVRSRPVIGVDMNAGKHDGDGFLAAVMVDTAGNRVGDPWRVTVRQTGTAVQRRASVQEAVSALVKVAAERGASIAVERLAFASVRGDGGKRAKTFRRNVSAIPTAQFVQQLAMTAGRAGVPIVLVDPAYTSKVGGRSWSPTFAKGLDWVGHAGAAQSIARRALGLRISRRGTRTRDGHKSDGRPGQPGVEVSFSPRPPPRLSAAPALRGPDGDECSETVGAPSPARGARPAFAGRAGQDAEPSVICPVVPLWSSDGPSGRHTSPTETQAERGA